MSCRGRWGEWGESMPVRATNRTPPGSSRRPAPRTNTPDEGFVLERHGRIVVGSACSGHGFKFAPVVGQRLARLAVDGLV
jgi:glycine/D-amino acid oxidase-like deaminating enzyme